MKDDDLPISTPTAPSSSFTTSKKETSYSAIFGRGRYKFWAFTAILLLAFWSMLTGTVTLRWSAGNLNAISDDIDIPLPEDLDVLEMEEREKLVKHMWDVYTNSRGIKLRKFWQEAFEAAYEELTSDVPGVPEDALSEIAKMSVRYIPIESPPLHSSVSSLSFPLNPILMVIWVRVIRQIISLVALL
uniref:Sugar transporter n=1 Tax=Solanum bulbocastanum TaxID=147425 RepID=A9XLF8_SOLBU|nr:unknown [Solanum bulbocastanum]